MKKFIPLFLVCLLVVSGCSSVQRQDFRDTVVAIRGDIHTVVVTGCTDLPKAEVALAVVQEFLPPDTNGESIKAGIILGEAVANRLCQKVLEREKAKQQ